MNIELTLAQEWQFMVSFWKPVLIILPFLFWAWLISSKLDKDARYHYLNPTMWNSIYIGSGVAALAAMLAIPWFFVGYPLGLILLAGPILTYWYVRNRNVPEESRFYLTSEVITSALEKRRDAKAARQAAIRFTTASGETFPVPKSEDPMHPVYMAVEDVIGPALDSRATRLEMLLSNNGVAVAQTIDGIRYKREPLNREVGVKAAELLMRIGGLAAEDHRRRQSGEFKLDGPTGRVTTNITTQGSSNALQMRLDFNRAHRVVKPFDQLGLLPQQLEQLRTLEDRESRHGIVLLGAPVGHGLTTLSYSFVNRHDAYTSNIKSLELEIETELEGVDQITWDQNNTTADYPTTLQSILRRDPDIVLTAALRDKETAQVAARPGTKGPLIYIPQHATGIDEQIVDWAKRVGDLKTAMKPLRAVVHQRLVRMLCQNCRQPYQPTADQLRKLNLPADRVKQLYRAGGKVQVKNKIETCPICAGSGYLNQTGIFEVMLVDSEIRKLLMAGDLKGARAQARRNKMVYLHEAALHKVIEGVTSIEELVRVTSATKPDAAGKQDQPKKQDAAAVG